jgi:hypothetical protein
MWVCAVIGYWQSVVAAAFMIERITERIWPAFWREKVDPIFTPDKRKTAFITIAVIAFLWGNFRAFDDERRNKEDALSRLAGASAIVNARDIN